jgi:hypothetical protein
MPTDKQKRDATARKRKSRENQTDEAHEQEKQSESSKRANKRVALGPSAKENIRATDRSARQEARSSHSRQEARQEEAQNVDREKYMREFDSEKNGPLHKQAFVIEVLFSYLTQKGNGKV